MDVEWLSREHVGTRNFKTLLRALSFVGDLQLILLVPRSRQYHDILDISRGMWPTLLIVVTFFWLLNTCAYKPYEALHIWVGVY